MSYYRYTSKVVGSRWKPITCPHCGCQFAYLIKREGAGEERTLLFDIGGNDAAQSAKRYALNDLERKLQNEFEVVHCPDCGMYPPQITKYIYEQRRGTPLITVLMIAVILVGLFICAVLSSLAPGLSLVVFGLTASTVVAIYFVINKKADERISRYDPNKNASQRRGMPFSEEYPVLHRLELEQLAKRLSTTSNLHIDIPTW